MNGDNSMGSKYLVGSVNEKLIRKWQRDVNINSSQMSSKSNFTYKKTTKCVTLDKEIVDEPNISNIIIDVELHYPINSLSRQ